MGNYHLSVFQGGLGFLKKGMDPTGPGLSPRIWYDCPLLQMTVDPGLGVMAGDDFTVVLGTGYPYELTGTNGTFAATAGSPGTALLSAPAAGANNEAHISYNNDVAGLIKCDASHKWWFESRIKLNSVAGTAGVFVGLMDEGASADAIMADSTGALTASIDCIGFQIVDASAPLSYWQTMMQLAARAAVSATAAVPTANYVKLGMKSIPNSAGTVATVYFYVDGVPLATTTTSAATDFPLDQVLIPHWSIKTLDTSLLTMTIDWWKGAQLR